MWVHEQLKMGLTEYFPWLHLFDTWVFITLLRVAETIVANIFVVLE